MNDRMTTGRFKVFAHLTQWWEEYRTYHRKAGLIVKLNDDILSATRVGVMMKRYAKVGGVLHPKTINTVRAFNPLSRGQKQQRLAVLGRR
jgi:hypothetical protein